MKKMLIAFCGMFLLFSFHVHAEEIEEEAEEQEQQEAYQEERLNNLELRLEELGFYINDVSGRLDALEVQAEENQLVVSDKLDLLVIGVNDLVNYKIEDLTNEDNKQIDLEEYQLNIISFWQDLKADLEELKETSYKQADSTVSGNNLTLKLNETIKENAESNSQQIEETSVYILIFLAVIGGLVAGAILSRFIKNG